MLENNESMKDVVYISFLQHLNQDHHIASSLINTLNEDEDNCILINYITITACIFHSNIFHLT